MKDNKDSPGDCPLKLVMEQGFALGSIYIMVTKHIERMEGLLNPGLGRVEFEDNSEDPLAPVTPIRASNSSRKRRRKDD